jgi:hypothetical protein
MSQKQLADWVLADKAVSPGEKRNRVLGTLPNGTPFRDTKVEFGSLTASAVQRKWKTPTEFPYCPIDVNPEGLAAYAKVLQPGVLFSRNRYGESYVELAEAKESYICVITVNRNTEAVKPWAVARITIENSKFIHESIGTFFELNGAKKAYFRQLGIDFEGDSMDDYC